MNAKTSWVVWVIGLIWFAAGIWGFIHGASAIEVGPKVGWMLGSLAFIALGIFLSYKVKKRNLK